MKWLMPQDEIDRLEALFEKYQAIEEVADDVSAESEEEPVDIVDGVALIKVEGVLTPKKLRWLSWFGEKQTVYTDIERKVREAEVRGATKIVFAINSPGGNVEGLYEAMRTIRDSRVPTETVSGYLLTSAAYMLASQTGLITAKTEACLVGSVGIVTTRINWGGTVKEITNSDSPKKRPDVGTSKGVKAVQAELDDSYQIFAEMVAAGRGVTVDAVKKKFGEGAVMTARTARQKKMIDAISVENKPTANPAANQGDKMNAKQLKEEHRAVYDEIFALGAESGATTERKRVCAHLVLAEGSGDFKTAHKAIEDGDGMDDLVVAKHRSAAMKRDMIAARQADNPDEIDATVKPTDDIQATKAGLEAGCDGLVWEPMEVN
jgi:ClpP class serine protease